MELKKIRTWLWNHKWVIFLVGFVIRFIPTFLGRKYIDFKKYRYPLAEGLSSGDWLYCDLPYNHTPLYPYLSGLMFYLSPANKVWEGVFIRLPMVFGDLLVIWLIYQLCLQFKKEKIAIWAMLIYALNPISFWEIRNSHWDGMTSLFFLISVLLVARQKHFQSGLVAGIGVLLKQFPVVILGILLFKERKLTPPIIAGMGLTLIVIAGFLPFLLKCPESFFEGVASHPLWRASTGGGTPSGSFGSLASFAYHLHLPYAKKIWMILFAAALFVPAFLAKKENYYLFTGLVMVVIGFFTFDVHRQLYLWALPFIVILTLEQKKIVPFVLLLISYYLTKVKPEWYFGALQLFTAGWYYVLFLRGLLNKANDQGTLTSS